MPHADTAFLPFHYFQSVAIWGKIKAEVHVEFMKVHCNSLQIGWLLIRRDIMNVKSMCSFAVYWVLALRLGPS